MMIQDITENIVIMHASEGRKFETNTAPATAKVTCIALQEELVFIDTNIYVDLARDFRKKMETRFKRKTSHLLLTHTDWDHIFAMEAFEDVTIVCSESCYKDLKHNLEEGYLTDEGRKKWVGVYKNHPEIQDLIIYAKIILPNKVVKSEELIGSSDDKVLFKTLGGHTKGSSVIYYDKDKVLCAGDNLMECYPQLQHEFNNPIPIFEVMEKFNAKHYIPGHGNVVSIDYIQKVKEYFITLEQFLKEAVIENYSKDKLMTHPKLPTYFAKDRPNWQPACRPDSNWLKNMIEDWYEEIKETTLK
jgi:glyoxylase-like metal-dependent hydrolase (beta-lactamase superfamily II)